MDDQKRKDMDSEGDSEKRREQKGRERDIYKYKMRERGNIIHTQLTGTRRLCFIIQERRKIIKDNGVYRGVGQRQRQCVPFTRIQLKF